VTDLAAHAKLLCSPPLWLAELVSLTPRLNRLKRPAALSASKPASKSIEREPHRDSGKPIHRPESDHAASRAEALNVRVAVSGELFVSAYNGDHLGLGLAEG
jgi:hypothetical protein